MKISAIALGAFLAGIIVAGCSKGPSVATIATSPNQSMTPPPAAKEATVQVSPYKQTTTIFEEFAKLVEQNQSAPEQGLARCKTYAEGKIPELKTLTTQIKTIETGAKAAEYMPEIMDSNEKIKLATDKISKIAQEKYGTKGADVMLVLADLALARL